MWILFTKSLFRLTTFLTGLIIITTKKRGLLVISVDSWTAETTENLVADRTADMEGQSADIGLAHGIQQTGTDAADTG